MFPTELLSLPLIRQVGFAIELQLGIAPISKTRYKIMPKEL